jgi:hypothetical protein
VARKEAYAMGSHEDTAEELSRLLNGLLDAIQSGEVAASTATRYRIEGAVVALDVLGGADPAALVVRLGLEPDGEVGP